MKGTINNYSRTQSPGGASASPGKIQSEVTLMRLKWIISVTVLLLAVMIWIPPLHARTYEVKKGDTLWDIGQKFQVTVDSLWRANKDRISDKDIIHPGQKLHIPDSEVFHYRHPNENPFSRAREPAQLIHKFSCPQEVKSEFVNIATKNKKSYEVEKGDTLWKLEQKFRVSAEKIYERNRDVITHPDKWLFPGQKLSIPGRNTIPSESGKTVLLSSQNGHINFLDQMGFGDYQVVNRVQVDFKEPQEAKKWRVTEGKQNYFLVLPLNCYNWGWYKQPRKKKKYSIILLPRFFRKKGELPSSIPAEKVERKGWKWRPGWDATAYAGHYIGAQEENNENWHQYAGGNISVFPDSYKSGEDIVRAGPAFQYLGWQGEADEAVDYSGDLRLLGGEIEYKTPKDSTSLTLYGGEKRGWVEGKGFPYKSRESADMFVAEGSHEWWYDRTWLPQMEVGTRLQFAFNESKYTTWDGVPIEEEPVQQGEYSGRFKSDIYRNYVATPTLQLSGGWREHDTSSFVEPRAGIEWFEDLAATDVSYQVVEGHGNNVAGFHGRVDLDKSIAMLVDPLTSDGQGSQTDKAKEKPSSRPYDEKLRVKGASEEFQDWVSSTS